jgi:hypothetical protein
MRIRTPRPGIIASVMLISLLAIPSRIGASDSLSGACVSVAIPDLIDNASAYDGKRIEIVGEAIGDKLARSNGVWVAVLADGTALGVFISASDASSIAMVGSYAHTGDRLLIRGTFHRACPEHGGDLDLHADAVVKLAEGRATPHSIMPGRAFWAVALCLSGAALSALWRLNERRRKNV